MEVGGKRMASGNGAPHGLKRPANDDLKNEQRLAKRFDLLNLESNGKLYVPVEAPLPTPPAASYSPSERMLVEDRPDRIYVHNLDEEIEEIENGEEKLVFLPDIEKKLGKIPSNVLTGVHPSAQDKQMILYSVPESISVPKENDSVRKAIIESRERAREEHMKKAMAESGPDRGSAHQTRDRPTETRGASNGIPTVITTDEDPEMMDIG